LFAKVFVDGFQLVSNGGDCVGQHLVQRDAEASYHANQVGGVESSSSSSPSSSESSLSSSDSGSISSWIGDSVSLWAGDSISGWRAVSGGNDVIGRCEGNGGRARAAET
jgi:hypothetical protein